MQGAAEDRIVIGQSRAEHDVTELANGRIGQPCFQVVLGHGDEGRRQNGKGGNPDQPVCRACLGEQINAEDIDHHLQHSEHTGFHHGDRMQQRADGCRCHHGGGKPAMERHQGCLADTEHVERQQEGQEDRLYLIGEDTAFGEVERAGGYPGPDHGGKLQADGRAYQDAEIDPRAALGFFSLLVGDQRVGREGQHFVEDEEREHVPGKSDAHGAGDGQGENTCRSGSAFSRHSRAYSQWNRAS